MQRFFGPQRLQPSIEDQREVSLGTQRQEFVSIKLGKKLEEESMFSVCRTFLATAHFLNNSLAATLRGITPVH